MAASARPKPLLARTRPVEPGLVWVLEDSPLEAEMARRALASQHTVEIFADGPAMIERLASGARPDALILDCQLPTLTGLEVCRFIRETFDEMELPIMMLTVEGQRADLVDGLTAGANDYLTKPYHVAELLARTSTLVRTRHLHGARVRRARELALTAEVGAMLTRGRDSSAQLCAQAIARHLEACFTGLWTAGKDGALALLAQIGEVDASRVRLPAEVAHAGDRFVREGAASDAVIVDPEWSKSGGRTFVAVPLVVDTRVVGALGVAVRRALQREEIDALVPLADLIALGLERLRAERERAESLEREQRARAEAEAANHSKDEFLAVLSHELRTPLNAIAGWVSMLRSGAVRSADVDRALATIERNTRAQTQLVDDLLDVSRIVARKLSITSEVVDLGEVVESVVESMRPAATAKKLALDAALDAVGTMRGDPMRLKQVVSNLITNAVKFTPSGGRVSISLRREGGRAVIRVEDTGQGIAPEFLPHVFERFRQAETSRTRKHGGLGLGLAIVRYLVQLHGGTVRAESAGVGRGSSFVVELPLAEAGAGDAPRASPSSAPPATACAGLDVLVVDDDGDARELVRTILLEAGASVRAAASVEDASAMLRARAPDVIVTDLGMPGTDGFELLRRVRAFSAQGPSIPTIALTAYARPEDRAKSEDAGFQHHLSKPYDPAALIGIVARLGRER